MARSTPVAPSPSTSSVRRTIGRAPRSRVCHERTSPPPRRRREVQHHVALCLVHLGKGGALDRAGVEHGRGRRPSPEVGVQHLGAMNVPREHGSESGGNVGERHHVLPVPEGELRRAYGGPFVGLVGEQHPHLSLVVLPRRLLDRGREPIASAASDARESGHREGGSVQLEDHGARPVEHVHPLVGRQPFERDARPLMVARDHDHGNPCLGDPLERGECLMDQAGRNVRPMKDISAVHEQVHAGLDRGVTDRAMVGEEVEPAPAPAHPRPEWMVESEVRVGEQEDAHGRGRDGSFLDEPNISRSRPCRNRPGRQNESCRLNAGRTWTFL